MWPMGYDGKPLPADRPKASYPPLRLIDGNEPGRVIDSLDDQNALTGIYTERAVRFLEAQRERPFFLYLAHSMPHTPLGVSDRFKGSSSYGRYGDVIQEIDASVGRILDTLDRLGLADHTLVLYTSDNGPWLNFGTHAGRCDPWREGKGTAFEGGVRVPCIARWPGKIPANTVCDTMAATIDVLPTIAKLIGAELPSLPIDGRDMWPLLEGRPGARSPHDFFLYYYGRELRAVGDGRFKLVFAHTSRHYLPDRLRQDGLPAATREVAVPRALYDLVEDRGETTDVAADHPEVVARLEAAVADARQDLGDSLTKVKGAGCREPGRLER